MHLKILAIVSSGFPGGQKIVLSTLMLFLYGADYAGQYAVIIAPAVMLVMLTAIGLGAKLMLTVPGKDSATQNIIFNSILFASLIYISICLALYFITCFVIDYATSVFAFATYLFYLSILQIFRHFYMAMKDYVSIFLIDAGNFLIVVILLVYVSDPLDYLLYSSLSGLFFLVIWYLYKVGITKVERKYFISKDIVHFSVNTVLSGGVGALLPLILNKYYGTYYTGILITAYNYFMALLLIPRSYVNYVTPDLVRSQSNNSIFKNSVKNFRNKYFVITLSIFTFSLIATYALSILYASEQLNFGDIIMLLVFIFSGCFGVVEGTILFVISKQKYNIYSNIFYFSCACFLFLSMDYYSTSVIVLFLLLSIISFSRWPYLNYQVKKLIL
jgi:O-antigen/teichoic acid export membrane protein